MELGESSINGQNACIGACHVGNQWQLALQLFLDLMNDRLGLFLGGLKWCYRGTFHCVFVAIFFLSWPFHVRQRAPNTVSHSCAMSACESQGECHWLFCATYGIYRFNLLHSGDQLELR